MDELDYRILEILSGDGRLPYNKIAEILNTDYIGASIRKRVLKLKKTGIIDKFTVVVNDEKVGLRTSFLILDVNPAYVDTLVEKIRHYPEIIQLYYSLDGKIICMIKTKREENLIHVVKEINAISRALTNAVRDISIITGLSCVKYNTLPVDEDVEE